MTGKELMDALEEIQQLKRALGLERRVIKVPKGTTGRVEAGTKGRCVVCDKEYEAVDCIRRCVRTNLIRVKDELREITIGYRVCYHCSPWTWDWQLERFNIGIDCWPERWLAGEDNSTLCGVGTKSVPTYGNSELMPRIKP